MKGLCLGLYILVVFLYDLFLKLKVTIFASYIEDNAMYVTDNGIDDVTQPSEKDSLKLIKWVLNN